MSDIYCNNQTPNNYPIDIPINKIEFNGNNVCIKFENNYGTLTLFCSSLLEYDYRFEGNDSEFNSIFKRSKLKYISPEKMIGNKLINIMNMSTRKSVLSNENIQIILLIMNNDNYSVIFLRSDINDYQKKIKIDYVYEKNPGEKVNVLDDKGNIKGIINNISLGIVNKIDFSDLNILIKTNINTIKYSFTIECSEKSWFERIETMLKIEEDSSSGKYNLITKKELQSVDCSIDEKYVDFNNIIGKSIIGVYLIGRIKNITCNLKMNEGDYLENKLYKIILDNGFYSLFLLRCCSNGYYSTELIYEISNNK